MNKDRREKIEQLKNIMNGTTEFKTVYVKRANDGNFYKERDIVTATYQIKFSNETAFKQWQLETGLEGTAYSPNYTTGEHTVVLKTEYEPVNGARPRKGKVMSWDEEFKASEAFQKREDTRESLCAEYLKHPPKGFTVTRNPYSVMIF